MQDTSDLKKSIYEYFDLSKKEYCRYKLACVVTDKQCVVDYTTGGTHNDIAESIEKSIHPNTLATGWDLYRNNNMYIYSDGKELIAEFPSDNNLSYNQGVFLVDILDQTRRFMKNNSDFPIAISLIRDGKLLECDFTDLDAIKNTIYSIVTDNYVTDDEVIIGKTIEDVNNSLKNQELADKNIERKIKELNRKWQSDLRFNISKADLEQTKTILDSYISPIIIGEEKYDFNINNVEAACLNQRYKEITGEDYKPFLEVELDRLNKILKNEANISVNGQPSIYEKLKNNIIGKQPGISIYNNFYNNPSKVFDKIKLDISVASLDDVKEILDCYDQESIIISGMQTHFRPDPMEAACLNEQYKKLTGEDHPKFKKTQIEILEKLIKNGEDIGVNGKQTINQRLLNNLTGKGEGIEIVDKNHVLNRHYEIYNSDNASLDDIYELLNYFDGDSVLIDGLNHNAYNDPIMAFKLNQKYKKLTGNNHQVFMEKAPNVIKNIMKDKDTLLSAGAYGQTYFDEIEQINNYIISEKEKDNYVDGIIQKMENNEIDINGQPIYENQALNKQRGYSMFELFGIMSFIASIAIATIGVFILFR